MFINVSLSQCVYVSVCVCVCVCVCVSERECACLSEISVIVRCDFVSIPPGGYAEISNIQSP